MNLYDFFGNDAYEKVKEMLSRYSNCQKCPELVKSRTQIVFPTYEALKENFSGIMFIGEAPGAREDALGKPFVGRSGQELDKLLERIGIKRKQVYISNTLLCRPPENRNPQKSEIENCKFRLKSEIEIIKPKVIVPLGNFSSKYVFRNSDKPDLAKKGITALRGKVYDILLFGIKTKVIPMLHPATILYSGGNNIETFYSDFDTLKHCLE